MAVQLLDTLRVRSDNNDVFVWFFLSSYVNCINIGNHAILFWRHQKLSWRHEKFMLLSPSAIGVQLYQTVDYSNRLQNILASLSINDQNMNLNKK